MKAVLLITPNEKNDQLMRELQETNLRWLPQVVDGYETVPELRIEHTWIEGREQILEHAQSLA